MQPGGRGKYIGTAVNRWGTRAASSFSATINGNLKGLGSTATERLIKLGVKENLELGIAIVYIYQTQSISRVAFDALCCC